MQRHWTITRKTFTRGEIGPMFAALVLMMMVLIGFVVDTGRVLIVRRRAQVAVDSAALAAATQMDEGVFKRTNQVKLNTKDAQAVGQKFGNANYPDVLTVDCSVAGTQVICGGSTRVPTLFMHLVGITDVPVTVRSSAEFKYGIMKEGQ